MICRRVAGVLFLIGVMLATCGCSKKKKQARQAAEGIAIGFSFDRAMDLLAQHQLRQAAAALKRIRFSPENQNEIEPLTRLALADATYYQGSSLAWIDARSLYLDFVTLNANHPLAPYAQLQVGLCSLKQVSAPSKDQTVTRQAIRDLQAVLERWPDSAYVSAAHGLLGVARGRIAESEYLIGRFYLKRKDYHAAIERLRGILQTYPEFAEEDKVLYYLGLAYMRSGNELETRVAMDRVVRDHPFGEYAEPAQKVLGSMGFTVGVGGPAS